MGLASIEIAYGWIIINRYILLFIEIYWLLDMKHQPTFLPNTCFYFYFCSFYYSYICIMRLLKLFTVSSSPLLWDIPKFISLLADHQSFNPLFALALLNIVFTFGFTVSSKWMSHQDRHTLKSFWFKEAKAKLLTTDSFNYWALAEESFSNKLYAYVYAAVAFAFYRALIKEFPYAL